MSWILYGLALSGLFTLAAFGLEKGLAALGRPTRWVWALALIGSVGGMGLAAGGVIAPGPGLEAGGTASLKVDHPVAGATHPDLEAKARPGIAQVAAAFPALVASLVNRANAQLHSGLVTATEEDGIPVGLAQRLGPLLPAGWILASLTLLLGVVGAERRLRRRLARWPSARILGHDVRLSDGVGPAVLGIVRPQVVIPSHLLALDQVRLHAVLLHEEEHRGAGDTRLLAASLAPLILVPWNPFLWLQHRRLREAMEADCDARVLRQGVSPRSYAATLLSVGMGKPVGPLPALTLSAPARHLKKRIRAMKHRSLRVRIPVAMTGGSLALLALLAACQVDLPTAEPAETPMAAEATSDMATEVTSDMATEAPPEIVGATVGDDGPTRVTIRGAFDWQADEVRINRIGVEERPSPLIVIDGEVHLIAIDGEVQTGFPADLDPTEILSIEVLKGEAARHLWGERGAHGVISITMKEVDTTP